MTVFCGILESACMSVSPSLCLCVRLFSKTSFYQSAGEGIKSHLVTALFFNFVVHSTISIGHQL